jgi:hypothetical protein
MARILKLKSTSVEAPNPVDTVVEKFGSGLKWAQVIEMRDIFDIAVVYNPIYTLENIEKIGVEPDDWVNVTINGKTFGLQYYSGSWGGSYQFRVNDTTLRSCPKEQVAEFLVGSFDPQMERFKHYRSLYKAIRDKVPNALELYKQAVKGMDWSYMMSDDSRWCVAGEWQENALIELGKLLSPEAEAHYKQEHDAYWNRVNSR